MRPRRVIGTLGAIGALLGATCSATAYALNVGFYSQQLDRGHARIGGSVGVRERSPGSPATSGGPSAVPIRTSAPSVGPPSVGGTGTPLQGVRTLPSNAPILRNPSPLGAGSFWFTANGQRCAYSATSNGVCFNVAAGAPGPQGVPRVDPRVLAQLAAQRLTLSPGQIVASPSSRMTGLTGAPSWFWLAPSPATESLTVTGGGERVTVTAVPSSVVWRFGDGGQVDSGPGHPYARRAAGAGSIQHVYRTRCLPGDQGHDPYVLASCTANGYQVGAGVEWTIGFQAAGPIVTAGTLPPRTTSTGIAYPVDEVRSFLTRTGAGQ